MKDSKFKKDDRSLKKVLTNIKRNIKLSKFSKKKS
jgi:hypothetical protein